MPTYRTVIKNGKVHIERKNWLGFWVDVENDLDIMLRFETEEEAANKIKEWRKIEKTEGKVLKEYPEE